MLGRLDVSLPEHQARRRSSRACRSPPSMTPSRSTRKGFDDPAFATFVAEHDGRVIGSAVGCAIEESSEHRGHRPAGPRRFPRVRGGAAGGARARRRPGARRGRPGLGARRRSPDGGHRLARDEPPVEPDLAATRLPADLPAGCIARSPDGDRSGLGGGRLARLRPVGLELDDALVGQRVMDHLLEDLERQRRDVRAGERRTGSCAADCGSRPPAPRRRSRGSRRSRPARG